MRNILILVALLAFGYIIYSNRAELADTWELLKNVDLRVALILPLVQLISYFFISGYYRSFIRSFGGKITRWRAFGTTTALNFVNQILPSGGASGTTYLIYAFKDKASTSQLTLIQVGRYVIASLTYVPMLAVAYFLLIQAGQMNSQLQLVFWLVAIVSLPGTILLILGLRKQSIVDGIVTGLLKFINWFGRIFLRRTKPVVNTSSRQGFLKEFHDGVAFIRERGRHILKPYAYMQLSAVAEIAIVYLAFLIVGVSVNPGVIIIGFTAANLVGAVSVIPGDVGVHELAIITVLSYIGVERETAIAGTLMYRIFNKVIVMSIGFVLYVKFLKPIVNNVESGKNGAVV